VPVIGEPITDKRRRRARAVARALIVLGVWFLTVVVVYARGGLHDRPGLVLTILSVLSVGVIIVAAAGPRWVTGPEPAAPPVLEYPGSRVIERWWPWRALAIGVVVGVLFGLWSTALRGTNAGIWAGSIVGASIVVDVWSWRWVHRRLALPLLKSWIPIAWLAAIVMQALQAQSPTTMSIAARVAYHLVWMPAVSAWIWIWVAYLSARLARALLNL
jgi:hypothetical protein